MNICKELTSGADSKEGLDLCFALSYSCRARFISQLLPKLRASRNARVLSVLNGGTMTSLALEQLARQEPSIVFLHSYPGWVKTDNIEHIKRALSSSSLATFLPLIIATVEAALFLLGTPLAEAG